MRPAGFGIKLRRGLSVLIKGGMGEGGMEGAGHGGGCPFCLQLVHYVCMFFSFFVFVPPPGIHHAHRAEYKQTATRSESALRPPSEACFTLDRVRKAGFTLHHCCQNTFYITPRQKVCFTPRQVSES